MVGNSLSENLIVTQHLLKLMDDVKINLWLIAAITSSCPVGTFAILSAALVRSADKDHIVRFLALLHKGEKERFY